MLVEKQAGRQQIGARQVDQGHRALDQAGLLEDHDVAVELFDERLTTVSAHQALRAGGTKGRNQRAVVDQTAAAVMLMAWLDGRRNP